MIRRCFCAHRVLGLDKEKPHSKEAVRAAYFKRAKECHPDSGGSEDEFKRVNQAYE